MDTEAIQEGSPTDPQCPLADYEDNSGSRFARETLEEEKQHLKTLSILYFLSAGLNVLGGVFLLGCFPLGFMVMDIGGAPGTPPEPPEEGNVCIGMGVFSLVLFWCWAYLLFLAGQALREQKRWKFLYVMAILNCVMGSVVGTILSIFTIIALNRDSVKELFKEDEVRFQRHQGA